MKVIKKNGDVIECTVEEYQRLLGLQVQKPQQEPQELEEPEVRYRTVVKPRQVKSSSKKWTAKEVKILKDFQHLKIEQLMTLLPGRSYMAIANQRSNLKFCKSRKKKTYQQFQAEKEEVVKPELSQEEKDKEFRRKYLNMRASHYQKQFNWPREKAMSAARNDFEVLTKDREQNVFPQFGTLSARGYHQLEQLVKHVVHYKGLITFDDAQSLELKNGEVWTDYLWKDFVSKFITNSEKIAKYLNVENHFISGLTNINNFYITYKKGGTRV